MKIMRIALVISVALNLLVLGIVGGAFFHLRGGDDNRERRVLNLGPMTPFVVALEDDRRDAVRDELRQSDRGGRGELRARFNAVIDVIRAEPFDAGRLRDVFAEQRVAANESQQTGEDVLIEAIAGMGADERTAYADKLQRWMERIRRK